MHNANYGLIAYCALLAKIVDAIRLFQASGELNSISNVLASVKDRFKTALW